MARREKKPVHKVVMTEGKRNIIQQLLQEYDIPQDRKSTFEPQIVKKRQKDISDIDQKIISMYAKGMTTRQISETIEDIYGFETSEGFISDVTDKILPQIEDWQNRPLDEVYPILYIDAIHYSVRDNGVIRKLAAYVILGIKEAISAAFPKTEYQRCIVHQVRNTLNMFRIRTEKRSLLT